MTATLNASTSNGVILTSDTSGNLDIQSNGTSRLSVTSTGVSFTNASNAAPAFSASQSAVTAIAHNTYTKIQFNTENFDTNSNYDNVTNYRFTPTVAGYYQINTQVRDGTGAATAAGGVLICSLYKNGVEFAQSRNSFNTAGLSANLSIVMYFNGSTDYVETWAFQNSGASMNIGTGVNTYFNGCYLRSA